MTVSVDAYPTGKLSPSFLTNSVTFAGVTPGLNATSTACNPRGPNSCCSFVTNCENLWQCSHQVATNPMSTTLPFKLERNVSLPEASTMVNSGALRGTGGIAKIDVLKTRKVAKAVDRIFVLGGLFGDCSRFLC